MAKKWPERGALRWCCHAKLAERRLSGGKLARNGQKWPEKRLSGEIIGCCPGAVTAGRFELVLPRKTSRKMVKRWKTSPKWPKWPEKILSGGKISGCCPEAVTAGRFALVLPRKTGRKMVKRWKTSPKWPKNGPSGALCVGAVTQNWPKNG